MKFSLLAAALVAISLTACDRPKQAMPESIEGYGTHTEEGTSMIEEREASGPAPDAADPEKFKVDNAMQAEEAQELAGAVDTDVEVDEAINEVEEKMDDEFSGKAVLPGHNLDGNGNPIVDGKDPTKLMH